MYRYLCNYAQQHMVPASNESVASHQELMKQGKSALAKDKKKEKKGRRGATVANMREAQITREATEVSGYFEQMEAEEAYAAATKNIPDVKVNRPLLCLHKVNYITQINACFPGPNCCVAH